MKKEQRFHQGDVQGRSLTSLPTGLKRLTKKPIAFGEHSGHQHVITGDYEMFEDEKSNIFVTVGNAGAVLQHIHESQFKSFEAKGVLTKADHHPISLQPNTHYLFGIHKKFNPFAKIWERVID